MENQEINQLVLELNENLKKNCCATEITPVLKKLKSNVEPHVKLYIKFCDACEENDNYEWYLFSEIYILNTIQARRLGIICHDCEKE